MDKSVTRLHFIRHSCYLWESEELFLLFDYYGEGHPHHTLQASPHKPLYILCSHSHHDHYTPTLFEEFAERGAKYIFHQELQGKVPPHWAERVTYLATGEEYQDDHLRLKAYGSTDEGGSFYVEAKGVTLFHAGDLNNWHWNEEASAEYIKVYEEDWHRELQRLTAEVSHLDLLMFPTDLRLGHDYLKGLSELLDKVEVRYLAPMHFNGAVEPAALQQLATTYHCQLLWPNSDNPHTLR